MGADGRVFKINGNFLVRFRDINIFIQRGFHGKAKHGVVVEILIAQAKRSHDFGQVVYVHKVIGKRVLECKMELVQLQLSLSKHVQLLARFPELSQLSHAVQEFDVDFTGQSPGVDITLQVLCVRIYFVLRQLA